MESAYPRRAVLLLPQQPYRTQERRRALAPTETFSHFSLLPQQQPITSATTTAARGAHRPAREASANVEKDAPAETVAGLSASSRTEISTPAQSPVARRGSAAARSFTVQLPEESDKFPPILQSQIAI
ncbi:hypothetical protein BU23DRAFT_319679 [Bimuria novae-zelandiae CBS 107.79]|uniref:Uncharacterized protein n=1 Tax=Bimuria novae-zelandiae CBS 107.79 TaxID=1447943 RepID=A0A6A5VK66_9PLEO|nr:hypothetical protein BU23DRAFT_319679 [Bimuria novae-zelandiae CBS 107.79]